MTRQKVEYFLRSALNYFSTIECPNCRAHSAIKVDSKYLVTRLFECQSCYLKFRHPVDTEDFSLKFYQSAYQQDDGITTELPTLTELEKMIELGFPGPKNASKVLMQWQSLFPDLTKVQVIDYGSSWGYMSYQFKKLGIPTQSFEVSKPRAEFGNRYLGLSICTDVGQLLGGNSLFYSSHVIEHVPSIPEMVREAQRLLVQDGVFLAECPNGSEAFRRINPSAFHQGWGLVHPNYLSEKFFQHLFSSNPYFITSAPFDLVALGKWDRHSQVTLEVTGGQILVAAIPNVLVSK